LGGLVIEFLNDGFMPKAGHFGFRCAATFVAGYAYAELKELNIL